jgi:hypothetical protein
MYYTEITHKDTGETLRIFDEDAELEYVDALKHFKDSFIAKRLIEKNVPIEQIIRTEKISIQSKAIFLQANGEWESLYERIKNIDVPQNLKLLLSAKNKREQERLLRNMELSPEILFSFILHSEREGYKLSQYKGFRHIKDFSDKIIPMAYGMINGVLKIFGKTELSEKQLKHRLGRKNYIIAKFLDKGNEWHCFFITYSSISGKETFLGEKQPHYHYVSDKFNLSRDKLVQDFKSGRYSLSNSPHIKLINYGNQPK